MTQADFSHLLTSINALTSEQARQLRQQLDSQLTQPKKPSGKGTKRAKASAARQATKPLTEAELRQHMLEIGLMSQLPDTDADFDDPHDQPIAIEGEPLSETIIRERRAKMAVYFFDSSGLVKRHVHETGSAWVRSLTRVNAGHTLYIARITAVEITSAITRRQRGGYLSPAQAGVMLGHFRRHLTHRYSIKDVLS